MEEYDEILVKQPIRTKGKVEEIHITMTRGSSMGEAVTQETCRPKYKGR